MAKSVTKLQPQFAGGDIPVSTIGYAKGGKVKKDAGSYADKVRHILGMLKGNTVPGKTPKDKSKDNMLVPMQSGEYVIPTEAVDKIGKDNLDKMVMSALGTVEPPGGTPTQGYAKGGYNADWSEPKDINQGLDFGKPSIEVRGGGPQRSGNWRPGYRFNPDAYKDITAPDRLGIDPRSFTAIFARNPWMSGVSNFYPPGWTPPSGLPGSWQGPTQIPTYFNPQGYPYAVPTSDYGFNSGSRHMGMKKGK